MIDCSKYDDKDLILLIREQGELANEAFSALYYRYSDKLKSFCRFKSNNSEDANEIFQETWIKFHSIILKGEININLPSYIYTIAYNLSVDKYRKKKNNLIFYEDIDFDEITDTLNLQKNIENNELLKMIEIAINQLNDIYSETFVLKWFVGLTYPQIAHILDESIDCIKQRSCRAMDEVLKILKPIISEINK